MHPHGHSVNFLAAQSECVQQASADVACVLREEREDFSVHEGQQGLVARSPHPVPRPVKGVGHGRAQHVVQVDLSCLEGNRDRQAEEELSPNMTLIPIRIISTTQLDNEVLANGMVDFTVHVFIIIHFCS